ncbi:caspase family protein [Micromonospora sp. WMMD975]|uniref:wHTH domain-containing protein n=1 Tax=Micromonospora sp. WMMD975 TaxID=3016087 RepID=UPI00249B4EE3|nr:caspase family protein [Micromonospora sp. WMMD975]WFE33087.1 caspase family protein [Micromonospora sp. WMMD975]
MAAFRALLLGVAEYDDPQILPLPFVTNDIGALSVALEENGYRVRTLDGGRLSRPKICAEVTQFLDNAHLGDNLLIYLSGHGAHTGGVDFLVPSEADLRIPLTESMVPLNYWAGAVERSRAGQVVFVVDACREGLDQESMALELRRWSTGRISHVAHQRIAFLFACGPGEKAQFVPGAGDSFSVFSRALQQVLVNGQAGRTLEDLVGTVNEQMRELAAAHDRRVQTAHAHPDPATITPFPLSSRRSMQRSFDWVTQAQSHRAWDLVAPALDSEELRSSTVSLVEHLVRLRREAARDLARDPWHEPDLATRIGRRVEFLTSLPAFPATTSGGELHLSAAEAALLVAGPYLYDTFWALRAARAAHVDPTNWSAPERLDADNDSYRRFAQSFPRLWRRLNGRARDSDVAGQIGWWLLHRWIARQSLTRPDADVSELIPLGVASSHLSARVFEQPRVIELLRSLRGGPGFLTRTDRPGRLQSRCTVGAGTADEQPVRERLVAYLLAAGRAMAVEAAALPEVVVEHMGISDPVTPEDLHVSIDSVEWESRGPVRVLRTTCAHPAIEIALRAHVEFFDTLLVEIQDAAAEDAHLHPLSALPAHASADQIRPSEGPDGRAYQSAGVRFHLAEDRIQELLMGEQLYGDPLLAIRELYQNALDACRYRAARNEYVNRTGRPTPAWEGRIDFVQGRDGQGRPYLECTDNGVGMGVRELTDVFSQAGTRFVETSEFVEEQSRWARLEPPIAFFPNSRFGVGVLSYFMLADEITVETCRFGQEGRPGSRLRVSIAGPGNLFRIRDTGPGPEAGTRVRLYLRKDTEKLSSADFLRRFLWVAEFRTTVTHDDKVAVWEPRRLSTIAPLGGSDLLEAEEDTDRAPRPEPIVVGSEPHPVWWCNRPGAVLGDGIWLQRAAFTAVVNLFGRRAPRLSVNRTQMLDDQSQEITDLLREAAGAAGAADSPLFSHHWLSELTKHEPMVADAVFELALRAGRASWPGSTRADELLTVGCYPPDAAMPVLPVAPTRRRATDRMAGEIADLTQPVGTWRLVAWIAAGLHGSELAVSHGSIIRAKPSDSILTQAEQGSRSWLAPTQPIPIGHLLSAATTLGPFLPAVVERLVALGYPAPRHELPDPTSPVDRLLLSRDIDGNGPWLDQTDEVAVPHLVIAAAKAGVDADLAADRLRRLGFTVRDAPADGLDPVDFLVASLQLDGLRPWLRPGATVSGGHVVVAAFAAGIPVEAVVDRLRRLGYAATVPPPADLAVEAEIKLLCVSDDLPDRSGQAMAPPFGSAFDRPRRYGSSAPNPVLDASEPLPPHRLIEVAERSGLSPGRAAERLKQLGYQLVGETFPDTVGEHDLVLLSRDLDGRQPWLDPAATVLPSHLATAATRLELAPAQVAARLAEYGYPIPAVSLPDTVTFTDVGLLSRDLDGDSPWLDGTSVVPPGHVLLGARRTGLTHAQVHERLRRFGFTSRSGLPDDVTSADLIILSQQLDGEHPWLDVERQVEVGHLVGAAHRTGLTPARVAERLREFGHATPEHALPDYISAEDTVLVSRSLDGQHPWMDPADPLTLARLVIGADVTGLSPTRVSQRLLELGFQGADEWHIEPSVGLPEGATVRLVPSAVPPPEA